MSLVFSEWKNCSAACLLRGVSVYTRFRFIILNPTSNLILIFWLLKTLLKYPFYDDLYSKLLQKFVLTLFLQEIRFQSVITLEKFAISWHSLKIQLCGCVTSHASPTSSEKLHENRLRNEQNEFFFQKKWKEVLRGVSKTCSGKKRRVRSSTVHMLRRTVIGQKDKI